MRSADELAEKILELPGLREVLKEFVERQLSPLSLYQSLEGLLTIVEEHMNEEKKPRGDRYA